jgi:Cu/Ag efflux protein CusF
MNLRSLVLPLAAALTCAATSAPAADRLQLAQAQSVRTFKGVGKITHLVPGSGLVTIDHEDIPGLMSAMEMQFAAKPAGLLDGLKKGDKVAFEVAGKTWTILQVRKIAP